MAREKVDKCLDAANNEIQDLFNVYMLKELPRLIILDLSGNSVCLSPDYRSFTVYHLCHLKILDGEGISVKEANTARENYQGKLTIELLGEKIGHFTFKNISELDLRGCKIKEVDCLRKGDFKNLRKLNLDTNLLANLDSFVDLCSLRILSLNGNKIEKLLSSDPVGVSSSESGLLYGQLSKSDSLASSKKLPCFLPQLEELYLGGNCICRIADLALYRFKQLKVLYLNSNKITKVGLRVFYWRASNLI